ncbi:MAG TPA: DUF3592 domain-containing protein [Aggregatilineales bacterium]|nr:DUF3592 domain-containing protein [Aggregatilineales bacterium]
MLLFVLFMVALASLPTMLAWRDWRAWYYLRQFGVETPAEIQYVWIGKIGLFDHYYVIYQFDGETPDGDYFFQSRHAEISRNDYMQTQAGTPLMVRYAANKPAIFRLASQSTEQIHWTLSAILAWGVAVIFIMIWLT